ncbi:MAG: 50S ribosomal protein L13 [Caldisericaceae bacterium]
MMKVTKFVKQGEVHKKWVLIDAQGQSIGRVATEAAKILRGKDKAIFTPNANVGDNVVVVNAKKVNVTGRKLTQKIYYRHSGYVGNMKMFMLRDILATKPEFALEHAIKLMLPKSRLGNKLMKGLRVFGDESYPKELNIERTIKFSEEE